MACMAIPVDMGELARLTIEHDGDDADAGLMEKWSKTPEGLWRSVGDSVVQLDDGRDVSPGQLVGYANALTLGSLATVVCESDNSQAVVSHGSVIKMDWKD